MVWQKIGGFAGPRAPCNPSPVRPASETFQVPVEFFFEGLPNGAGGPCPAPLPNYVSDFLATTDGISLTKAFMQIRNAQLRRSIVNLVEGIAGTEEIISNV